MHVRRCVFLRPISFPWMSRMCEISIIPLHMVDRKLRVVFWAHIMCRITTGPSCVAVPADARMTRRSRRFRRAENRSDVFVGNLIANISSRSTGFGAENTTYAFCVPAFGPRVFERESSTTRQPRTIALHSDP